MIYEEIDNNDNILFNRETISNWESVQMLQHGNTSGFIGYVATNVIAGFALIALGYWMVKA